MKKIVLSLALVGLMVVSIPAAAEICTIDNVPAATLLLPYFEVDLDDPNSLTTMFAVTNASAAAQLVHVVVWSDLSVPVLDFNIYLTGYDVQTVNMRDILAGKLPRTASDGQDPSDTISPQGDFSDDIDITSCDGQLPPPGTLPASFVQHLEDSLTGQASSVLGGLCAGQDLGDNVARGYVSMDVVNNCTLRFPGDPNYLTADIDFDNVLFGDYFYVDNVGNFAQGSPLVHVESCPSPSVTTSTAPCAFAPGEYTFYGRYETVPFVSDEDQREPLAQTFGARYLDTPIFDGGTDFIVWRDSKVDQAPFTCPARVSPPRPPWYPLGQNAIVIFDEEENPDVPETFPVSPQPDEEGIQPFPAEAQRTAVNGPDLPTPFDFGWMFLDLGHTIDGDLFPGVAQNWVTIVMSAEGRFSVGYDAAQLDSVCSPGVGVPGGAG